MYAIYTFMLVALFHRWLFGLPKLIIREMRSVALKTVDFIIAYFYPEQSVSL